MVIRGHQCNVLWSGPQITIASIQLMQTHSVTKKIAYSFTNRFHFNTYFNRCIFLLLREYASPGDSGKILGGNPQRRNASGCESHSFSFLAENFIFDNTLNSKRNKLHWKYLHHFALFEHFVRNHLYYFWRSINTNAVKSRKVNCRRYGMIEYNTYYTIIHNVHGIIQY